MITSTNNQHVKHWKKLQTKKGRRQYGAFWVEGFHLVQEALKSNWSVEQLVAGNNISAAEHDQTTPLVRVTDQVFDELTQTETPQRIGAVVTMQSVTDIKGTHVLLIDAVQDPGNLGTMIRTADAAGFDGVVAGLNSVDIYNDKVIRATQGSLFHIPVIQKDLTIIVKELQTDGFTVWASASQSAESYTAVTPDHKVALLVGNEGAGISQSLISKVDTTVSIPIRGGAESLNVSIAAAILMYYIKG